MNTAFSSPLPHIFTENLCKSMRTHGISRSVHFSVDWSTLHWSFWAKKKAACLTLQQQPTGQCFMVASQCCHLLRGGEMRCRELSQGWSNTLWHLTVLPGKKGEVKIDIRNRGGIKVYIWICCPYGGPRSLGTTICSGSYTLQYKTALQWTLQYKFAATELEEGHEGSLANQNWQAGVWGIPHWERWNCFLGNTDLNWSNHWNKIVAGRRLFVFFPELIRKWIEIQGCMFSFDRRKFLGTN